MPSRVRREPGASSPCCGRRPPAVRAGRSARGRVQGAGAADFGDVGRGGGMGADARRMQADGGLADARAVLADGGVRGDLLRNAHGRVLSFHGISP